MATSTRWFYWAILSAVFVALTAIFAKIGIQGVDSDLATLIRTAVIIVVLSVFVAYTGKWANPNTRHLTLILMYSVPEESWNEYGQREQTRREHLVELQTVFGFKPFTMSHYRQAVHTLTELALQTDKGIVLASTLVENLRRQTIILPAMNAIERASAEAITRANRRIYAALTDSWLSPHRQRLDELLKRKDSSKVTWLA